MKAARFTASLVQSVRCLNSASLKHPVPLAWQLPFKQESSRSLTSTTQAAPIAAPDIQFPNTNKPDGSPRIKARIVPTSPSYFTGNPHFTDNLLSLESLLRKYEALPVVEPSQAPRLAWRTIVDYRNMVGETVGASRYEKIVQVLQRLSQIHPALMPAEVKEALDVYKREVNPMLNRARPILIDRFGRALAVGRRKASTARAWVVQGTGEVLINGRTLVQHFGRVHDRESALWALKATERIDKYNVWALVEGGGTTGQAEALTLAVAKALLVHEPLLKPALRRSGCITRDPRRVERKKPGHLKARKKPAWVKR